MAAPWSGIASLAAMGAASRVISFALNNALVRYLQPSVLGMMGVELELLNSTVGFLGREPGRLVTYQAADTREKTAPERETQAVVNAAYVSVALSAVLGALVLAWHERVAQDDSHAMRWYVAALLVEAAAEPAFVLCRNALDFSTRGAAETLGMLARAAVTFGGVVLGGARDASAVLRVCAWAQIAYSLILLAVYLGRQGFSRWPIPRRVAGPKGKVWLVERQRALFWAYGRQTILKFLLTESDRLLLAGSAFATPQAKGAYALVSNYGSLLARLLFLPVEEASRAHFAAAGPLRAASNKTGRETRSQKARETNGNLTAYLENVLGGYLLLAELLLVVGLPYSDMFLALVGGARWNTPEVATALRVLLASLPLLAWNGVLEGFVQTRCLPGEIDRFSRYLFASWALCQALGLGLLTFAAIDNAAALLFAVNGVNALLRLGYCSVYVARALELSPRTVLVRVFAMLRVHSVVLVPVAAVLWGMRQWWLKAALDGTPWGVPALGFVAAGALSSLVLLYLFQSTFPPMRAFIVRFRQRIPGL